MIDDAMTGVGILLKYGGACPNFCVNGSDFS